MIFAGLVFFVFAHSAAWSSAIPAGRNLLSNPGFESGNTDWAQDSANWQVSSEVSHSGKSSICFHNSDPNSYPLLIRSVPVQVDGRYRISAWVKTQDVVGKDTGASIALEYYDGDGKYVQGGCYPVGINGTKDWTLISAESLRVPSNVRKMIFIIYLRNGCTGTAWYDDADVEVFYDFMLRPLVTYPTYRNTIYPWQKRRLELAVQAVGNPEHPTDTLAVRVSMIAPSGKIKMERVTPGVDPDVRNKLAFKISDSVVGRYRIKAELVNSHDGSVYQSKDLAVDVAEPGASKPRVYIDESNRCIVDGTPFFPLGFYFWGDQLKALHALNMMGETKFNCIVNYTLPYSPLDAIKAQLDAAENHHIKVIFSVKDCYEGSTWGLTKSGEWTNSLDVMKGMVNTFKDHPSILAWYINDELSGSFLPAIAERYDLVKKIDKDHPALQVLYPEQEIGAHADTTDVLGIDHYPVWNKSKGLAETPRIEGFGRASELAQSAVASSRAVWMVPECSSIDPGVSKTRLAPTYEEMMCESFQALVHGARGLIFFDLHDLIDFDSTAQWAAVKRVGEDLNDLKPIILGLDVPTSMQTSSSDKRVSVLTRNVDGKLYTLAVNPYHAPLSVTYQLMRDVKASRIEVGTPGKTVRILNPVSRTFTDTIEPLGVRVYALVK